MNKYFFTKTYFGVEMFSMDLFCNSNVFIDFVFTSECCMQEIYRNFCANVNSKIYLKIDVSLTYLIRNIIRISYVFILHKRLIYIYLYFYRN